MGKKQSNKKNDSKKIGKSESKQIRSDTLGAMEQQHWNKFSTELREDPTFQLAKNAVCNVPVSKVALKREEFVKINHNYNTWIPENKISNQKSSGRCWIFALLNCLRYKCISHMNTQNDFELSQVYLHFWDKVERANYFLESMIENIEAPLDSRLMHWFFNGFWSDGGQWQMLLSLIDKYGVVPKYAMPETESSSNTALMNKAILYKLQDFTCELRKLYEKGSSEETLRSAKNEMMKTIYRIASTHLGEPPKTFELEWKDKDQKNHNKGMISPLDFYEKYINENLHDYVCLIHCPQKTKSFLKTYTVKYLGNVVGGVPVTYLNVPMETFKKATVNQLKDGEPVWFGCDVGKYLERNTGMDDMALWDYQSVYGTNFSMDKAERLDFGQSLMTHAMVLTGVGVDHKNEPVKWRIENSWGETSGDKGFYGMSDAWFDEFMYEVAIHKKHLSKDLLKLLDEKPEELEPWDPMGSLA